MRQVPVVVALLLLLAGCGSGVDVIDDPVSSPYAGPLHVDLDYGDTAPVLAASGAAGRSLECTGAPYRGGGADYDSGLLEVADSAEDALDEWLEGEGRSTMPADGYRVERADEGHVLFSFDRDARTVADVVAADHVTDWNGHRGWGVEAWATCDPAELGDGDVDDGVEVWTGEAGRRIPTSTVKSFQGPEHCDWQDITFLWLGSGSESDRDYDEYLRDPAGELADFTVTSYDGAAALPDDARSTGWRHDGRELWVARHPRAAYLVSVDDPDDVERWPASKRPIRCA